MLCNMLIKNNESANHFKLKFNYPANLVKLLSIWFLDLKWRTFETVFWESNINRYLIDSYKDKGIVTIFSCRIYVVLVIHFIHFII